MAVKVSKKASSKAAPAKAEKGKAGSGVPAPSASRDPMVSLRREIDRLFDDFTADFGFGRGRSLFDLSPFRHFEAPRLAGGMIAPHVDVTESDKEIKITAELPGMSEKDVELVLTDDVLTLKGEKTEEKEEKDKDYHVSERTYGSFRRSFRIPNTVNADKVSADFKNGVLSVTLPKSKKPQKKAKKVDIRASS
jgi:HSP20 family protein